MKVACLPAVVLILISIAPVGLDRRTAYRLLPLGFGALFAHGWRTVTSWLRAVGITTEFPRYYYAFGSIGRRISYLAGRLLCFAIKPWMRRLAGSNLRFAIDDTPTKHYGPRIEGASQPTIPRRGLRV